MGRKRQRLDGDASDLDEFAALVLCGGYKQFDSQPRTDNTNRSEHRRAVRDGAGIRSWYGDW